ncbi:MAG: hypothetical protein ACRC8D_07290 [Aeromonas sp.]
MTIFDWIKDIGGISAAAAALKENPRTVASWVYGEKIPGPEKAQRIIAKSKGRLDFNRVYAPLLAKQAEKRAVRLTK